MMFFEAFESCRYCYALADSMKISHLTKRTLNRETLEFLILMLKERF